MNDEIVPTTIDENVNALVRKLGLPGPPQFVPVQTTPTSIVADCFANVDTQVAGSGGAKVYGWKLWLFPDVWVAAEFHAVWRSPQGQLIDVTPSSSGSTILFVSDPTRTYNGRTLNNVHHLISKKPIVAMYVELADLRTNFQESRRVNGALEVAFEGAHADLMTETTAAEGFLRALVRSGASRNHDCPCRSGDKFKQCHEKSLGKLKAALRQATMGR